MNINVTAQMQKSCNRCPVFISVTQCCFIL